MARRISWCVMGILDDSKNSYRKSSFKLTFGIEAIILVEVSLSSLRREPFDDKSNDESCKLDFDCLDEDREYALQRMNRQKMTKYHDQRVKLKRFNNGDLVLCRVIEAMKDPMQGKLNPTWEDPYKIIKYSKR